MNVDQDTEEPDGTDHTPGRGTPGGQRRMLVGVVALGLAVISAAVWGRSCAAMDGIAKSGSFLPAIALVVAGLAVGPAAVAAVVALLGLTARACPSGPLRTLLTAAEALVVLGVVAVWGVLLLTTAFFAPFMHDDAEAESLRATLAEQVSAVDGVAAVRGVEVVRPSVIGITGHNVVVEVDLEPAASRPDQARALTALAEVLDRTQTEGNRGFGLVHSGSLIYGVTSAAEPSIERAALAADLDEATDAATVTVLGPSPDLDLIREGEEAANDSGLSRVELVTDGVPVETAAQALPLLSGAAHEQTTLTVSTTAEQPFPGEDELLVAGRRSLSISSTSPAHSLAVARALDQQPWVIGYTVPSGSACTRVAVTDRARAVEVAALVREAIDQTKPEAGAGALAGLDSSVTVITPGPDGQPVEVPADVRGS